jgi:hypothetical protein
MNKRRPQTSEYHPRYERYIHLVPEVELPAALAQQLEATGNFSSGISEYVADTRYAPEKLSIREAQNSDIPNQGPTPEVGICSGPRRAFIT